MSAHQCARHGIQVAQIQTRQQRKARTLLFFINRRIAREMISWGGSLPHVHKWHRQGKMQRVDLLCHVGVGPVHSSASPSLAEGTVDPRWALA